MAMSEESRKRLQEIAEARRARGSRPDGPREDPGNGCGTRGIAFRELARRTSIACGAVLLALLMAVSSGMSAVRGMGAVLDEAPYDGPAYPADAERSDGAGAVPDAGDEEDSGGADGGHAMLAACSAYVSGRSRWLGGPEGDDAGDEDAAGGQAVADGSPGTSGKASGGTAGGASVPAGDFPAADGNPARQEDHSVADDASVPAGDPSAEAAGGGGSAERASGSGEAGGIGGPADGGLAGSEAMPSEPELPDEPPEPELSDEPPEPVLPENEMTLGAFGA